MRINSNILIKSLIAYIKRRYNYIVSYKRVWLAKEKSIAL